ncbi:MAG: cupin domain-containing protein [Pseudomonadota bacterium]
MKLHRLDRSAAETIDAPVKPEALLAGQPSPRAVVTYDAPGERLCVGEWTAEVGTWRVTYDEWEYCLVVSGRCVVTGDDGTRIEAGPGDAFVLEPGFTGTWQVLEPMRKHWVVRTP